MYVATYSDPQSHGNYPQELLCRITVYEARAAQRAGQEAAAAARIGNSLEMQSLGLPPQLTEPETLGVQQSALFQTLQVSLMPSKIREPLG